MVRTKRTQKEIEKDCKRIKEAAKVAKSLKDIERATNLSYSEINTTLKKHQTIFKRIKEQLIINKKQSEIEKNNKKEPELLVKAEKNTNFKKQKETKEVSKVEITTEPIKPESEIQKELVKKYVLMHRLQVSNL